MRTLHNHKRQTWPWYLWPILQNWLINKLINADFSLDLVRFLRLKVIYYIGTEGKANPTKWHLRPSKPFRPAHASGKHCLRSQVLKVSSCGRRRTLTARLCRLVRVFAVRICQFAGSVLLREIHREDLYYTIILMYYRCYHWFPWSMTSLRNIKIYPSYILKWYISRNIQCSAVNSWGKFIPKYKKVEAF